jgi:hypothetical protein
MRKCIVSTHYNRPICSNWQISTLSLCEGLEDWDVFFFIEPTMYSVSEIVWNCNIPNKTVIINKSLMGKYGNLANAKKMIENEYDFVFYVSDDTILAWDTLKFMSWASENLENKNTPLTVTPYSFFNRTIYDKANSFKVKISNSQLVDWTYGYWPKGKRASGEIQYYPVVSRVNNVGFLQGKISDPSLSAFVKGLGHDIYNVDGLFCNPLSREWLKLDEKSIMTRQDISYYAEFIMHKDWSKTLITSPQNEEYFVEY